MSKINKNDNQIKINPIFLEDPNEEEKAPKVPCGSTGLYSDSGEEISLDSDVFSPSDVEEILRERLENENELDI